VFIAPDYEDPRLKQFEGRKRTFNGGMNPLLYLNEVRKEKWLQKRKPLAKKEQVGQKKKKNDEEEKQA